MCQPSGNKRPFALPSHTVLGSMKASPMPDTTPPPNWQARSKTAVSSYCLQMKFPVPYPLARIEQSGLPAHMTQTFPNCAQALWPPGQVNRLVFIVFQGIRYARIHARSAQQRSRHTRGKTAPAQCEHRHTHPKYIVGAGPPLNGKVSRNTSAKGICARYSSCVKRLINSILST